MRLYSSNVNGTGAKADIITKIMFIPTKEKYSLIPPRKSCTPKVMKE